MPAEQKKPVVHLLWINAGLSCDGDSVALTAAMQPSIEDIVLGTLPGLPKVEVHWPLIAYETGPVGHKTDDFIEWFFKGERGEIDPFVLVIEGSIPNEAIKEEGYWCGFGNNPATGQPMTTSEWLDRVGPEGPAILAAGARAHSRGDPCHGGQPHRGHGSARLPRLGVAVQGWPAHRLRSGLPDPPGQPLGDDFLSALSGRGAGPYDPPGRSAAADVAVRRHRPRGMLPGWLLRAGRVRH